MDITLDRRIKYGIVRAVNRLFILVVLHSIIIDGMCVHGVGLCQTRGGIEIIAIDHDRRTTAIEHDKEI